RFAGAPWHLLTGRSHLHVLLRGRESGAVRVRRRFRRADAADLRRDVVPRAAADAAGGDLRLAPARRSPGLRPAPHAARPPRALRHLLLVLGRTGPRDLPVGGACSALAVGSGVRRCAWRAIPLRLRQPVPDGATRLRPIADDPATFGDRKST